MSQLYHYSYRWLYYVVIINLYLMSSGQGLNTWRHRRFFVQFVYLLCLFQNNIVIRGRRAEAEHDTRTGFLKSLSLLIPSWRGLTVPCSDATRRRRENSAAVIQTQNILQNVVLTPLLSLSSFYHSSIEVNLLSFRRALRVTYLTALSMKGTLQYIFDHVSKYNLFFN